MSGEEPTMLGAGEVNKHIKMIQERVTLLKTHMAEAAIYVNSPAELLSKTHEVVHRHKELLAKVAQLESEILSLHAENIRLRNERLQQLNAMGRQLGLSLPLAQEQLVRELMKAMSKNKELKSQVNKLEGEVAKLEKTPQQQYGIIKPSVEKEILDSNQSQQKNRNHGSCSQDWPDVLVLDVGEIEENSQEILAQNILETGQQAGNVYQATSENPWPSNPPRENQPQLMFNDRAGPSRGASFEDCLKSITETVLNKDQQNQIQRGCGHSWNSCGSSYSPQTDYSQSIINTAVDMSTAVTTPNSVVNVNVPPRPESVSPPGPGGLGLVKTMSCSKMAVVMAAVLGLVTDEEAKKTFEALGDWRG